jgi:hypothetical protein
MIVDDYQNTNDLATKKQRDFIIFLLGSLHFKKNISLSDLGGAFFCVKNAKQKWFNGDLLKNEASSIISYLVSMGNVPQKGTKEWDLFCKHINLTMSICEKWDNQNHDTNNIAALIIHNQVANAYNGMSHRRQQLDDSVEYGCR